MQHPVPGSEFAHVPARRTLVKVVGVTHSQTNAAVKSTTYPNSRNLAC
jgi:hypothetical protein